MSAFGGKAASDQPPLTNRRVSKFDQFFVGLPIKLIPVATSNLRQCPRPEDEDMVRLVR